MELQIHGHSYLIAPKHSSRYIDELWVLVMCGWPSLAPVYGQEGQQTYYRSGPLSSMCWWLWRYSLIFTGRERE